MLKKLQNNFRAVKKNKATLAINIICLVTTIMLGVFILHESSYNQYFTNADDMFRPHTVWITNGNESVQPIGLRQAYRQKRSSNICAVNTRILKERFNGFINNLSLAFLISCPISLIIIRKWSNNFAYKTSINPWLFIASGILVGIISLSIVTWHSWSVATRNQVETLRFE